MHILYTKSKWEMWDDPLEVFLRRARADGFDGTEIWLKTLAEPPNEVAAMHRAFGLVLVAQTLTEGDTPDEHVRSLEAQTEYALACDPLLINHHAGRDRFSFEDNARIFRRLIALGEAAGLPFLAETHRGRPTYSLAETRRYLEALPELSLTADVSHWMVVHESDLSDQEDALALALGRSRHVHARVGYEEGPQVPDPRAPEWRGHVERHLAIWQRIVDANVQAGADVLTITPEFGPPHYMHTAPFTEEPVADTWEVNVFMRDLLRERIRTEPGPIAG